MFKRTKPSAVPPMTDINPALVALHEKKEKVGAEAASLRDEDRALALAEGPEDADENREARLASILGNTPPARKPTRATRRQEIRQRLRDLADAREIIDRDIQTETARASALLQERLRPEYRTRVRALTDALIALDVAANGCRELSGAVGDAGYSNGWMTAHFSSMLEGGRNGPISLLLHEIAGDGYLKPTEIPKALT